YFFTAILMLGVDEVASQLEQPFPHLPLHDIAESTLRDVDRFAGDAVRTRVCGCGWSLLNPLLCRAAKDGLHCCCCCPLPLQNAE
ncbi:hypothetical protein, partial [Klebsiella aerogenes]|uniref:hypothetical protein n=1 Tax=Klebsiella aerogenes TaxID=548 RepID=UPI001CC3D17E